MIRPMRGQVVIEVGKRYRSPDGLTDREVVSTSEAYGFVYYQAREGVFAFIYARREAWFNEGDFEGWREVGPCAVDDYVKQKRYAADAGFTWRDA